MELAVVERLCKPETHTVSHRKTEKKKEKLLSQSILYILLQTSTIVKSTHKHTHITTSNYLQKIPSNEGEDQS